MAASLAWAAPARRLAAFVLLALLVALLLPLLASPVERWFAGREALEDAREMQARIARVEAKAAAVAALASRPDAPFLRAGDEQGAFRTLQERIEGAMPPAAMRIEALQPLPREARAAAPVAISFGFTAMEGAMHAFLTEIETRPPFLAVDELEVASRVEGDGRVLLSGMATLSAVPLIRARP